jgi:hypothetical protein
MPAEYPSKLLASSLPKEIAAFDPFQLSSATSKHKLNNVMPYKTFSKQTPGPRDLTMTDNKFFESIENKIH